MKGSLIVVAFFVLGVLAGRSGSIPEWMLSSGTSFVALCALLLCVGISIGLNPDMKSEIKSLNPRLALLPVATILGSWMGAAAAYLLLNNDVCSLLHHRQLTDCLAVDSGFAYYSLSSIFITEYRGAELGTIALLANIIREMITLLLTPLLAKWFGPLAPISSGGATTMDTTLPIITQTVGQRYVSLSIYHGFVTDFTVPFFVTMWCTLV
ncbi:lysine exporter LysO family protein [Prevotella stercorea]|uniref:lysine exporter LysO family protein n=1 Tax=Leyella stercorea TaxID=363265 RepID=UPI001C2BD774|nr:lysine exporter LysO family protein [Leyella stercorea]MBU9899485.1 lysine exporter LysO family protein [Leyella stercorea]MBU9947517.1 lysine exporter LysO family protein [Leyella stercorea]